MAKIALILHAEPGTHDALGRALHALMYTQELHDRGHDVRLLFDGGGTLWIDEFAKPDSGLAPIYHSLKTSGVIAGVCSFCIDAFEGDRERVKREGLPLVDEYHGHPSIARLIEEGRQILIL